MVQTTGSPQVAAAGDRGVSLALSSEATIRCAEYDIVAGRCQLLDEHGGVDIADVGDAYVTWLLREKRQWRRYPPPLSLVDLAWVPGFQPTIHDQG